MAIIAFAAPLRSAAGPAGNILEFQQRETVQRIRLVCQAPPMTECPANLSEGVYTFAFSSNQPISHGPHASMLIDGDADIRAEDVDPVDLLAHIQVREAGARSLEAVGNPHFFEIVRGEPHRCALPLQVVHGDLARIGAGRRRERATGATVLGLRRRRREREREHHP